MLGSAELDVSHFFQTSYYMYFSWSVINLFGYAEYNNTGSHKCIKFHIMVVFLVLLSICETQLIK
jgi:hypothetical protein